MKNAKWFAVLMAHAGESEAGGGTSSTPEKTEEELAFEAAEAAAAEAAAEAEAEAAAKAEELAELQAKKDAGEELTPEEEARLAQPSASEEEELVVLLDGEDPPKNEKEPAPQWVKDLRKRNRELEARNRELEAKENEIAKQQLPVLGKKPELADADINYDESKFSARLEAWYEQKRKIDEAAKKLEDGKRAEQEAWHKRLNEYEEEKKELRAKVKDLDEAEATVQAALSPTQQGLLIHVVAKPALLVLVLGKNQQKLEELAAISDNAKFIAAISKLEDKVKIADRKAAPPPPEKQHATGGVPTGGNSEKTLERLRAEAAKTGDYTEVAKFKRQLREREAQQA